MPHPLEDIARQWMDAFNGRHLEALLGLYADDAAHYSPKLKARRPETNGFVRGKPALRAWWQDAFDRLPSLRYQLTSLTANDDQVFMEYLRTVDGEPDLPVAEVLAVRGRLIVDSRVYHG